MASDSKALYKYYKSVQIKPGDTLVDLSYEYVNPQVNNTDSFIDEVCYINNLDEDSCLYAGNYIVVPYYAPYNG